MSKTVEPKPLTLADIQHNMQAVSYVPGHPEQPVIRFRFASTEEIIDDREEHLLAIIKEGEDRTSYYDLVSLGLGRNHLGEEPEPKRICIAVEDE